MASTAVGEVIVTATKRAESVQRVPISMNVVTRKQLEAFNTASMKNLADDVPSMVVLRTNSVNTISLRGFGSSPADPTIDQDVALYVDGIYQGRARQYMAPFFDVSRVEVLRGPQGSLLGKNTAAGAVSIITNDPTPSFQGGLTASYLIDRRGVDAFGYVSGPVAPDLDARLSFKYLNDQGWMQNLATHTSDPRDDSGDVRLGLLWTPLPNLQVDTKLQYDNLNVEGRPMAGFPATLSSGQAIKLVDDDSGPLGITDFDHQKGYHFSTKVTAGLGDLTLVSITGAEAFNSDSWAGAGHANPNTFGIEYGEQFSQYSEELRLLSPTGKRFEWVAGIYADTSNDHVDTSLAYDGTFIIFPLDGRMTSFFRQSEYSVSAYGTGTFHVTDAARIIAGLRWTDVNKDGSYHSQVDFGTPFIGDAPIAPISGSLNNSSVDPSVTLQYDFPRHIMAYASYSQGSKGGLLQSGDFTVTPSTFKLQPETSTNYEVGLKTQPFDWLTFNIDAYHLEFHNLQVGQYVNNILLTKNAAAGVSQGVEVLAAATFGPFRLDASGAYDDAKYTNYPGASCTQAEINAGCVNGVTPTNGAGLPFTFVPRWSGHASVTYTAPVSDRMKVTLIAATTFASSYFVDDATYNPFDGLQKAYAKVDLRAELASIDDRWAVAVIAKNVGGVLTSDGVYSWPFNNPPLSVYTIDEPRSVAIQLSAKF